MVHYPSRLGSESINLLDNPRAITSAKIENGFGRNKEDEKRILYHLVSISVIAIRKSSQKLMRWVSVLTV